MVEVLIYTQDDLKKSGGFKKKFEKNWILKKDFFKYLKENELNISYAYCDVTGNISNGKKFRCSYNGMIIGTLGIVKEFN